MLRDAKARMSEAADDQVWPLLEAAELPPSEAMQVGDGVGQGILHSALDAGIARLLGIELGGVGRQVGYSEVPSVCGEEGGCPMRPVRVEPIPDHQERLADLPAEVPQGQDHRRARDAAADVPRVEPTVGGDRDDAGDLAPLAHAPQQRRRTAARPGGARPLAEAMSGLIKEDECTPLAAGPLF
jgi:hypothetical protein